MKLRWGSIAAVVIMLLVICLQWSFIVVVFLWTTKCVKRRELLILVTQRSHVRDIPAVRILVT